MADMSKKEASEWLMAIKRDYIYGGDEDYDKRRKIALDMGAEALENQKTGHWIESNIPNEKYVCSECGGACWYYDFKGEVAKSKYCPNCGTKMEGE